MTSTQARLWASFAALPFSFLAIPYIYWRGKTDPQWALMLKPFLIIFGAWLVVMFLPVAPAWIACFGLIVWISLRLKDQLIAARPPEPREEWRR